MVGSGPGGQRASDSRRARQAGTMDLARRTERQRRSGPRRREACSCPDEVRDRPPLGDRRCRTQPDRRLLLARDLQAGRQRRLLGSELSRARTSRRSRRGLLPSREPVETVSRTSSTEGGSRRCLPMPCRRSPSCPASTTRPDAVHSAPRAEGGGPWDLSRRRHSEAGTRLVRARGVDAGTDVKDVVPHLRTSITPILTAGSSPSTYTP